MMRVAVSWVVAGLVVLSVSQQLWAQWTAGKMQYRGLFGERTLGEPLKPGTRPFSGGLLRGPHGMFVGRDSRSPSALFRPYR
ncbi:MAG TPA: hypothetical protein EYH34_05455, partial [Planctomycetes bacterium]|nr:hypothetical protein [Planctomycetota bacterium]